MKKKRSHNPPRARAPSYRLNDDPGRVELVVRAGHRGIGCFMAIFLTGWSAGCAFLIYRVAQDPQREHILFAVPFLVGWLFAFCVLLQSLLGRERFVLDSGGATFHHQLLWKYGRVAMPLDELVGCGTATQSDETDERQATRVLDVRTIGRPIRFGSHATDDERAQLASLLDARIGELQKQFDAPPRLKLRGKSLAFGNRLSGDLLGESDSLRTASEPPIAPPGDSKWRTDVDVDAVSFTHAGHWSTGGVIGLLMLNAFWSGIVSVFVYQLFWGDPNERPQGLDWLWQFLFLIPFELIGLVMFLGLLLMMLEPVRRYRWRYTRDEARAKLSWLGLGYTWRYPLSMLDRLEVRLVPYQEVKKFTRFPLGTLWAPKGCPTYTVALIDSTRRELCRVEGLTLGEACHWADTLVRSQPQWFT